MKRLFMVRGDGNIRLCGVPGQNGTSFVLSDDLNHSPVFFTNKPAAKDERDKHGTGLRVSPGPDHRRFDPGV